MCVYVVLEIINVSKVTKNLPDNFNSPAAVCVSLMFEYRFRGFFKVRPSALEHLNKTSVSLHNKIKNLTFGYFLRLFLLMRSLN